MKSELAVLGLGSNVPFSAANGEYLSPPQVLFAAFNRLSELLRSFRSSSVYVTEPMHYKNQSLFANAVVCGFFAGTPRELLKTVQSIEREFGRNRADEILKGPRTLDIDIELFGNYAIKEADLIIPHEFLTIRPFVLIPLLEILPDSADPVTGKQFADIVQSLPSCGVRKLTDAQQSGGFIWKNRN